MVMYMRSRLAHEGHEESQRDSEDSESPDSRPKASLVHLASCKNGAKREEPQI